MNDPRRYCTCRVVVTSKGVCDGFEGKVFQSTSLKRATELAIEWLKSVPDYADSIDFVAVSQIKNKWEQMNTIAQDYVNDKIDDFLGVSVGDRWSDARKEGK